MPRRQKAEHDGSESVHSVWVRPPEAVAAGESGERNVMFPTRLNLELLEQNGTVDDAMSVASGREVVTVLPKSKPIDGNDPQDHDYSRGRRYAGAFPGRW